MIKEKRLAVVLTHPVQYYSGLFQQLAKSCVLKVFYTAGKEASEIKYDKGFQKEFKWDIPLLDGYEYSFLQNTAAIPDHSTFFGVKNIDLISSLEHFAPNAILFFGWSYHSHLKVIRYFKGKVPVWFRGDSTLLDHQNWFWKSLRWFLLTWIYSHVDKAFYVGTANKAYFKRYGLKDGQLVYAPHPIDNERFSINRSTERLIIRERLGIKENQILILFAGKYEAKKNPTILLNAFLDLKLSHVHLLFVGNGPLEKELKTIVKKTNGMNKVHFMDFQNQSMMPAIYQSCELFCLPSAGPAETWGLAVNEAMAAGKAILVSNKVGSGKDLVFNGKNGYIFESGNTDDLKRKMLESTRDIHFLNKMGQVSLQIINKCNYSTTKKALLQEL
jgi:glycosyltransferase involved in cell wall biosynthesis